MPQSLIIAGNSDSCATLKSAISETIDLEIVGETETAIQTLWQVREKNPDMLLLNAELLGHQSESILQNLSDEGLKPATFIFDFNHDAKQFAQGIAFGASFLVRGLTAGEIVKKLLGAGDCST